MSNVIIHHNFYPDSFMWLWAKYVSDFNPKYHCTHCIKGPYSKIFSKTSNNNLAKDTTIVFNEHDCFDAIYICGVSKEGYRQKKNYIHNVHCALKPEAGFNDEFSFEDWHLIIQNGRVLQIPEEKDLPKRYFFLPKEYTTCRIFRWAACFYEQKKRFNELK